MFQISSCHLCALFGVRIRLVNHIIIKYHSIHTVLPVHAWLDMVLPRRSRAFRINLCSLIVFVYNTFQMSFILHCPDGVWQAGYGSYLGA